MTENHIFKKLSILSGRVRRFGKRLYHQVRYRQGYPETLLFIMGCQRSGTGLMARVLRNDPNSRVFGEFTPMNSQDTSAGIRLDSPEKLRHYLSRLHAPLVVVKPLVESQNALSLLSCMDNLRIIWLYRDYKDVVASNIIKFGETKGVEDIRPIFEGDINSWKSEHVSEKTRDIVRQYYSEDMSPADAAALFWYARNSLYFEQNLDMRSDVMLVAYYDLVQYPDKLFRQIYTFLGRNYPGDYIFKEVHRTSLGKGQVMKLTPDVEHLCSELLGKMNTVNHIAKIYK